ncbi:sensor histidine kinase [Dinghuibacter silviterrae]|uniref:Histidine kinase n=1 Tax=Dinghuibacter silviterrae TaxID=1539049 RepID=A0A4R8DGX9_9BACT|nr:histidine kinase [Dinghuibacter silviterrae]TDW96939.1 histidine kinase [Dinghuibacter silviterrae]
MKKRWNTILTHAAVWAVVLSLPYLLNTGHGMAHHNDHHQYDTAFFYLNAITSILWIGPYYVNTLLLTPRLFNQRRYAGFALGLVLLFALMVLIHLFLHSVVLGIPDFNLAGAVGFLLPAYVLTIAVGTTIFVVEEKIVADQLSRETELSFLRSQINPHFIFNILNNLVALERMKSEELGPTILKLSSLMQYMLYETDEERVPLNQEVEYLQSYIDLQRQRFGQKVPVTVNMEMPGGFYEIEPMLLIPFVENAFKHGVGLIRDPAITIDMHVRDGLLHFSVKNRYNPTSEEVKDKTSGIGLANVRRRLNLLYGQQQTLHIVREADWFTATLELNLHQ